jgi:hypothetical protein
MKSLLTAFLMLVSSIAIAEPQSGFEYTQTQQVIPTENPAKIEWSSCSGMDARIAISWSQGL